MDGDVKKLIREAIDAIKRGDLDDALLALERTVDPKYHSKEHAHGAYLMRDHGGEAGSVGGYFAEALGHQVAA